MNGLEEYNGLGLDPDHEGTNSGGLRRTRARRLRKLPKRHRCRLVVDSLHIHHQACYLTCLDNYDSSAYEPTSAPLSKSRLIKPSGPLQARATGFWKSELYQSPPKPLHNRDKQSFLGVTKFWRSLNGQFDLLAPL